MTDIERAKLRSEARAMPLDDLRSAHFRALRTFCLAGTEEELHHAHETLLELSHIHAQATAGRS